MSLVLGLQRPLPIEILADPRRFERLAFAFGLFSLGQNIGFFGGTILGGVVIGLAGWHGTFGIDFLLGIVAFYSRFSVLESWP